MAIRNQPKIMPRPPSYPSDKGKLLAHITTDKPFYKPNEVVFI